MKALQKTALLLISFLTLLFSNTYANSTSKVKYFGRLDYEAASQNWSVSTAPNGNVFIANHNGLLEFDGSTWELHKLPNQTIMRAVHAVSDSLIFTSGFQELGYWRRDIYGKLHYQSLNDIGQHLLSKNIEFWNIVKTDNAVYFHSFATTLCYSCDSVFEIPTPGFSSVLSYVNGKTLLAVRDKGIYEVNERTTKPFLVTNFFKDKLIRFMLPYRKEQVMIGTEANGIFIWNGSELTQWKKEWKDYFISNELNRGHYSKDGKLTFGTIIDGVVLFDENENFLRKINTQNGLRNNTVLGIDKDKWGNSWLALDDGIGFIPARSDESMTIESIPGIGAIYSTAIIGDKMYFGTNQGLFVRSGSERPRLVPETQGQVWDCKVIDGKLWVGHNQGTFIINNDKAQLISNFSGGASLKKDNNKENYIQGTYTGLVNYTQTAKNKFISERINGFVDLVRYLEIDHLGNIWASHMHLGVFKIVTNDQRDSVTDSHYYGVETFGQNHSIHVFKVENRIVLTTGSDLFTYDDLKDTIVPHKTLNKTLGELKNAHRIIEAPNHHYWFISKENIALFKIQKDQIHLIKSYPTSLFHSIPLVDQYENILPLSETKAILSLQNGIATFNAADSGLDNVIQKYKPELRQIVSTNNKNNERYLPLQASGFKLKYHFNNLKVKISFPYYSGLPQYHQYYLKGLDMDWSKPSPDPFYTFKRLPFGEYTLKIRTTDSWGNKSQELELPFEVLPPWYISNISLILYFMFLVIILAVVRKLSIKQTQKKQQREHDKKEKELVQLRNEKLRNEIRFKSKELANSTMLMIKKNEFLLDLKNSIDRQKAELGSRYPDKYYNHLLKKIDANITNQDDWQVFENNFERAHEQFFEKMKKTFPTLTSSDLRLCAYLRMNLSSKEIAPLLGISVRGVENHRYRLRKKMNMMHDDSLTDIILKI